MRPQWAVGKAWNSSTHALAVCVSCGPWVCRRVEQHKRVVFAVKESLTRGGYLETFAVHRARVPIVKFVVPPHDVRSSRHNMPQH